MKLLSAELHNFCQHRYLKAQFAPGLTAILGRNGSGKSNLVKAIYASVTGDFGRNDGVKTDNICQFAEPGAQSRINVTLEHGGSTLDITRSLRPITTRLRVAAQGVPDRAITKAQEATEAVSSILGVSARILADYVFVDQWSIFDFLSMMPAERAKAFQRLFRTERAEALWKLIGDHHDTIVIPTPGIDKDVVLARLTENKEKHEILCRDYSEVQQKTDAISVSALHKVRDDYNHRQATERSLAVLKARIAKIEVERKDDQEELAAFSNELVALDDYIKFHKQDFADASAALAAWNFYTTTERNRTQLQTQLVASKTARGTLVMPEKPIGYFRAQDRNTNALVDLWFIDYEETQHEIHQLTKLVAAIKSGVTVCNACGSPIQDAAKHLVTHECRLAELLGKKDALTQQLLRNNTYDNQCDTYARDLQHHNDHIDYIQRQLDTFDDVAKPEKSREELTTFIAQYNSMCSALHDTSNRMHQFESAYQHKIGILSQLNSDLHAQEAELAQLAGATKEAADAAQQQIVEYDRLRTQKMTIAANRDVLARQITDDTAAIAKLEGIEEEAKAIRAWADYCMDMRHIFHRDNLPRLVAQNYLELMEDEINNLLIRFGSSFSVQADDSLSFMATFHDGRRVPAARLSGGEKVLLALAFRVAVNDIFAKDLGLLILDEPTAGLDEGNIACLRIAIERLKELSAARGLQVIMITHERDLHNLFDHVIEVGKEP